MANWAEPTDDGVRLHLWVQPKASTDRVVGQHADRLKVAVTAAPEKGKANKAVCRLIAKSLGCAVQDVVLVSGDSSREKAVEVDGVKVADLPREWSD